MHPCSHRGGDVGWRKQQQDREEASEWPGWVHMVMWGPCVICLTVATSRGVEPRSCSPCLARAWRARAKAGVCSPEGARGYVQPLPWAADTGSLGEGLASRRQGLAGLRAAAGVLAAAAHMFRNGRGTLPHRLQVVHIFLLQTASHGHRCRAPIGGVYAELPCCGPRAVASTWCAGQ